MMDNNQPICDFYYQERQFNRILVAIRQQEVFLYPPLASFMLGQQAWSLNPTELAILSLLSEYGKPVVAEKLCMNIDELENHIMVIHDKLESMKSITDGLCN